jgi:IS30 family transposase
MARPLPFTAVTDTGDKLDIEFALHPSTESAVRVHQLLGDTLETISREVRRDPMSNGDVLQALAMALAVRARMIAASTDVTAELATTLVETALASVARADIYTPPSGNA